MGQLISEAARRVTVERPLTHSFDLGEEGLAMHATRTCSIDDCDRPAQGRGWCKTHWLRWRKHGDPNYVRVRTRSRCTVAECDSLSYARGFCSKHYHRARKSGDPLVVGDHYPGRPRLDRPGYAAAHKRVMRARGKASEFSCVDCGRRAHEWSYDGGSAAEIRGDDGAGHTLCWSPDESDYSPRCRPCHRRRDESLIRGRDSLGRWAPA